MKAPAADTGGGTGTTGEGGGASTGPFTTRCTASCLSRCGKSRYLLSALGFDDGSVHLVDPRTGVDLCHPSKLVVANHHHSNHHHARASRLHSKSALAMDADGGSLLACQRGGDVCLWELRFAPDPLSVLRKTYEGGSSSTSATAAAVPPSLQQQTQGRGAHGESAGAGGWWNQLTGSPPPSPNHPLYADQTIPTNQTDQQHRPTPAPPAEAFTHSERQRRKVAELLSTYGPKLASPDSTSVDHKSFQIYTWQVFFNTCTPRSVRELTCRLQ